MKQFLATITATETLADSLHLLTLASPDLPHLRAGQLILVRVYDSFDPYLRCAYFAIPPVTANDSCSILITGEGEHKARPYKIGDTLDIIAPIGNGFTLAASTRRVLFVGDEVHLAPLIALAHEATQRQVAVTMLVRTADGGRQTADEGRHVLEKLLPLDVEYQFVSDIQSDLLQWPDQICAAGSLALYTHLKERITQRAVTLSPNFTQVSVAPPMACGFGVCLSCAVETTRGMRLACVDGPVFDLMDVIM